MNWNFFSQSLWSNFQYLMDNFFDPLKKILFHRHHEVSIIILNQSLQCCLLLNLSALYSLFLKLVLNPLRKADICFLLIMLLLYTLSSPNKTFLYYCISVLSYNWIFALDMKKILLHLAQVFVQFYVGSHLQHHMHVLDLNSALVTSDF